MTAIFTILMTLLTTIANVSGTARQNGEDAIRHHDEGKAQIVVDELQN